MLVLVLLLEHRNHYTSFSGEVFGFFITGIGMANDAHARISCEHTLYASRHCFGSIRDRHLSGMQRVSNADASAVVN
jgi:hypothetical protein